MGSNTLKSALGYGVALLVLAVGLFLVVCDTRKPTSVEPESEAGRLIDEIQAFSAEAYNYTLNKADETRLLSAIARQWALLLVEPEIRAQILSNVSSSTLRENIVSLEHLLGQNLHGGTLGERLVAEDATGEI